ncbi:uncharacterized protein N7529_001486 [Penicillium soppii]|uniref:uncharacterized protein n=1 Tax=Penicillium soppii TaxID=69789 RepID=UPI002546DD9B|nr:uncharacterized protein N7529_001486 [Penicillium soppii]KAJ5875902.1 hypothetical protein N7529_001486 [Penicillium soppii]
MTATSFENAYREIARKLQIIPPAIKQASAYVSMNGLLAAKYLEYYQSRYEDITRYEDTCKPVAMTWIISFNRISAGNPLAALKHYLKSRVNTKKLSSFVVEPCN